MFAKRRAQARQRRKVKAVVKVAADTLSDSNVFQFRADDIGGEPSLRTFVGAVSKAYGYNVHANIMDGLVSLYGDDEDFVPREVVVLTIGSSGGIPR